MLPSTPDQKITLSELRGRPVILAFYPADWSPVCGDQMVLYNEVRAEFVRYDAQLLGISVDGAWCHAAFARYSKLHFPLLADFEPKGAVARSYGVYRDQDGMSERALFVIDAHIGRVRRLRVPILQASSRCRATCAARDGAQGSLRLSALPIGAGPSARVVGRRGGGSGRSTGQVLVDA
jgi:peroxiredoxin